MSKQHDPTKSARLHFRAPATPEDDDFFKAINNDRLGQDNSNDSSALLYGNSHAKMYQNYLADKCLVGAVIWLPADSSVEGSKDTPLGCVHLMNPRQGTAHHRHSELGIHILPEHQGRSYGREAIEWALDWGFKQANLHRVMLSTFEYNTGAIRLYERIGFKTEGRYREHYWQNGRYWDYLHFGILDREWAEIRSKQQTGS